MSKAGFSSRLAGTVGLGVLAATLVATPLTAHADQAVTLVVNEAYGGGGNSGATYTHDFVELYNPGDEPVALDGLSLQYRSASGGGSGFTDLTGMVPAQGHFLVQQAQGNGGSTALPTPDLEGSIAMSGSAGIVALVEGTGTVDLTQATAVDLVGWGSNAVLFETAPAPGTTNPTSVARTTDGVDTDDNSTDFQAGPPTPQNSGGTEPPPPPDPVEMTIAEIQGTGPATPVAADQVVITRGVVTAAYPTGGFNGFYIQTPGPDETPGASDAVFVYQPGFAETIEVGDSVEVQGLVTEYNGLTEINADAVTELEEDLGAVVPRTVLPGSDCALPGEECPTGDELEALREASEGEVFLPEAPVTVTDVYDFGATSSNFYGEIGLAVGSEIPLVTPTEVVDAQDTDGIAARTAYNEAHSLVLDDGSSANYWNTSNSAGAQDQPVPWLTQEHTVRVGASVTFDQPVVLDYRFGWKLQPPRQVVGEPTGLVTFEQDRTDAPADVGGDLRLATFNVLNYFTTFGADVEGCTAYVDREDDPVATNRCPGDSGPRGAWEQEDFERQQVKIVKAINRMDADVVSLEELENSATVDGHNRDEALAALVTALNDDAGTERWAYVPSPSTVPEGEDVIRNAFIYDPSTVEPAGESEILQDPAFHNARDPLAQVFQPLGRPDSEQFVVVVNHFKSKGSGEDDGTGQGLANPDRIAQARALTAFADDFAADRGVERVFLTGDFNAYSMEDPVQEIAAAGYTQLESTDDPEEETYSFDGASGSLDHVFANEAALAMVTGTDIWEINANESVYYQYSRHNYVGTLLYAPDVYAASDHNPVVVGLSTDGPHAPPATVSVTRVTPKRVLVRRTRPVVHVQVGRADGTRLDAGTVEVRRKGKVLGSAEVRAGRARVRLPRFKRPGKHRLAVRYVGDGETARNFVEVRARKAKARVARVRTVRKDRGRRTLVRTVVRVKDETGAAAVGKVRVKVRGSWSRQRLVKGRARLRLGTFRPGRHRVVVQYLGNKRTTKDRLAFRLRVR